MFVVVQTDACASDRVVVDAVFADFRLAVDFRRVECVTEDDVIACCADADAVMPAYAPLSARVLARLRRCRVAAFVSTGSNGVDLAVAPQLGIVGLGRIGRAVAARARVFGLQVVAYDPYVGAAAMEAAGAAKADLDHVLGRDDVSLHCALTDETRGLVDARALARMKRTAFLITTARGACVDTAALRGETPGFVVTTEVLERYRCRVRAMPRG